jgi:hypothetical protein
MDLHRKYAEYKTQHARFLAGVFYLYPCGLFQNDLAWALAFGRPDLCGLTERLLHCSLLRCMPTFVDFRHAIRKGKLTGIDRTREMAKHASRALQAINLPDDKHGCVQAIVVRGQRNQDDILVSDLSVLHD